MQVEKPTEYFKKLFLNMKVQVYKKNKQIIYIRCVRYWIFKPNCDEINEELIKH